EVMTILPNRNFSSSFFIAQSFQTTADQVRSGILPGRLGDPTYDSAFYDVGHESIKALVEFLPVEFITPAGDPVDDPVDAGTTPASIPDGANEFTFSTATTGVLTMKLKVKVQGIGSSSPAELAKFTFELDG